MKLNKGEKLVQNNAKKVALIAGATGTAGYGVTSYLLSKDDWQVLALSRTIKENDKKKPKKKGRKVLILVLFRYSTVFFYYNLFIIFF